MENQKASLTVTISGPEMLPDVLQKVEAWGGHVNIRVDGGGLPNPERKTDAIPEPLPEKIGPHEVAKIIDRPVSFIYKLTMPKNVSSDPDPIPFYRNGRRFLAFKRSEVIAWAERQLVRSKKGFSEQGLILARQANRKLQNA